MCGRAEKGVDKPLVGCKALHGTTEKIVRHNLKGEIPQLGDTRHVDH